MKIIYTILYTLFCLFLFWLIIHYVSYNFTIIEGFSYLDPIYSQFDLNTPKTSHNVNLPINTTYSCQNICGPKSQCYLTGEQCTSDIDCYGCQPPIQKDYYNNSKPVEGDNDAGRLIYNQNPQYSTLTTDIANTAGQIKPKAKVPQPYLGIDKWMKSANAGMQYYYRSENSQTLNQLINLPEYPVHESATGLFEDYGPLPANAN